MSQTRFLLWFLAGVSTLWLSLMALALTFSQLPARATGQVLVVFPPTWSPEARFNALSQAQGGFSQGTNLPFAWVVQSDSPGFAGELRAQGAWATYGAVGFISWTFGGCSFSSFFLDA